MQNAHYPAGTIRLMAIISAAAERCRNGPAGGQILVPFPGGMQCSALPGAAVAAEEEQNAAGASEEPGASPALCTP